MSGGHFNGMEFHILEMAEMIADDHSRDETVAGWTETGLLAAARLSRELIELYGKVKAYDYAVSCDTSEKDFVEVMEL